MHIIHDHPELTRMYDEDVKEKATANWSDSEVVHSIREKDRLRRKRVRELIREGALRTGADYHHAALIFQHGESVVHFKQAQELARKGIALGEERSKWLYAAATDRALVYAGKPQRFGTQFRKNEKGDWEMGQVDPNTTDEERAQYNVPPLSQALATFLAKYKKL